MASDATIEREPERPAEFGALFKFHEVYQAEIALINERRARDRRATIKLEVEAPKDLSGEPVFAPAESANVVGLALSGGGIRSAAFCLGVLQALHEARVLHHVDYMSTVSGGGYIGCSLAAAIEWTNRPDWTEDKFPFTSRLKEDEPTSLQHIRDYSNYLFPNGAVDLLCNASIYVRGLVVNAILMLPFLLVASAFTLLSYSLRTNQTQNTVPNISVLNPFGVSHFFLTVDLALILVVVSIFWGIIQSTRRRQLEPEIPGWWTVLVGTLAIALFASALCEVQPFVLDALLDEPSGKFAELVSSSVRTISTIFAPLAAAIAFFGSKLGEFVKSAAELPNLRATILAGFAKAAICFAGLVVPMLMWVVYLDVTYWGLCTEISSASCSSHPWFVSLTHADKHPVMVLYLGVALGLLILSLFTQPNANSLHPLYRDRLGKTFLFRPAAKLDLDHELEQSRLRLSDITGLCGPYPLINTALNIQASKTANRRGRNADFFMFSPKFVGSKATDYVATRDVENVAVGLDLATAMAASGAAVSSNMGAQSIKPLTATLALLNIRLGYWLRNPRWLKYAKPPRPNERFHALIEFSRRRNLVANYYFLLELFGRLSEKRKSIYLTDGGHIENLGIYELLRRRCRVIIAVDAEADLKMAFGSFNTLERFALIDLGIRIDLPWQQITNESLAIGAAIGATGDAPKHHGPHCAIGMISYPNGRNGILVYIKASVTGDENDYIFDYKKRHGSFPHETTFDQLFTEEQFEAYRALGFHEAYGLFNRSDKFAYLDPAKEPHFEAYITLLDRLFPRIESDGPLGQKQTFAAWMPRRIRQRSEGGAA